MSELQKEYRRSVQKSRTTDTRASERLTDIMMMSLALKPHLAQVVKYIIILNILMLSFSKFVAVIKESKGWMSPSGVASPVSGHHAYEHHPEVADAVAKEMKEKLPKAKRNLDWDEKSQSVGMAQRKGYTRFGKESKSGYCYVHYDKDAPGGKESALYALRHLKPRFGQRIHVTTHPEYKIGREFTFDSPGKAAHHN